MVPSVLKIISIAVVSTLAGVVTATAAATRTVSAPLDFAVPQSTFNTLTRAQQFLVKNSTKENFGLSAKNSYRSVGHISKAIPLPSAVPHKDRIEEKAIGCMGYLLTFKSNKVRNANTVERAINLAATAQIALAHYSKDTAQSYGVMFWREFFTKQQLAVFTEEKTIKNKAISATINTRATAAALVVRAIRDRVEIKDITLNAYESIRVESKMGSQIFGNFITEIMLAAKRVLEPYVAVASPASAASVTPSVPSVPFGVPTPFLQGALQRRSSMSSVRFGTEATQSVEQSARQPLVLPANLSNVPAVLQLPVTVVVPSLAPAAPVSAERPPVTRRASVDDSRNITLVTTVSASSPARTTRGSSSNNAGLQTPPPVKKPRNLLPPQLAVDVDSPAPLRYQPQASGAPRVGSDKSEQEGLVKSFFNSLFK